jgi:Xaa-Pro dipeptidase
VGCTAEAKDGRDDDKLAAEPGAMMERRRFLEAGAAAGVLAAVAPGALAGAASAAASEPAQAVAGDTPPWVRAVVAAVPPPPPGIEEAERAARRERARQLLEQRRAAALFLEPGPALHYFADVAWGRSQRPFGLLLPVRGEPVIICPAFEARRAEQRVAGRFPMRTWQEDESPYALIGAVLRERGAATGPLALEGSVRGFIAQGLGRDVPALALVDGDPVTESCRGVKSPAELAILRYTNNTTLRVLEGALAHLREGMTQRELGQEVQQAYAALGYPGWVLPLIGESSAYPHGSENPQPLRPGDVVLVDTGLQVHGYQADVTRTIAFGAPAPAEVRRVHGIVREAQAAALAATRPGRRAGEIDAVARAVVERAGFGPDYRYFTHRLGHGIGLELHEWPYLVRGSPVALRPGMTFSNEPGIYQYGSFGVRLEDIMVVTETGAELLTPPAAPLG